MLLSKVSVAATGNIGNAYYFEDHIESWPPHEDLDIAKRGS